jgi:PAS domain S-box-containing protein
MAVAALRSLLPARTGQWSSFGLTSAALVAIGYFAGCLAGFALRFPGSGISFFWPPTAVLTAALALTAPAAWPSLLAGSFLAHAAAHAYNGVPVAAWPVQFLGNATQAMLAAAVLQRFPASQSLYASLRKVLTFILGACLLAPAAASVIPAYVYVRQGWAPDVSEAWLVRFVSNAVASLTLVPSLLVVWQSLSARRVAVPKEWGEFALILLGLVGAHTLGVFITRTDLLGLSIALFSPVPFLLWATIRLGGVGLSLSLLSTSLLTVSMAMLGQGPLAAAPTADAIVGVQIVLVATAVPMMLIAGLLEQFRAEHDALLELERQKTAILGMHPDLMFVQTRSGVYLEWYANDTTRLLARPDLFVGRSMYDILPAPLAERFADAFERVTPDQPVTVEYTLEMNGGPRRFEARCVVLAGDRVLSIVRDITDRWRDHTALQETRERYALATAAGGVGVWDLNLLTNEVRIEGTLAAMLGYREDEIGARVADWLRLIHADDVDFVKARLAACLREAGDTFDAEFRMVHRDGSVRWIAGKGMGADRLPDGSPTRMTGTFVDTTERKQSASALKEANDTLVRMGRITALSELSASIAHELHQPLTAIAANGNACLAWIDAADRAPDLRHALTDMLKDVRRAHHIVERTQDMFRNQPVQRRAVDTNDLIGDVLEIAESRLREQGVAVDLRLDDNLPLTLAEPVQIQQVILNLIVNGIDAMDATPRHARTLRITSRRSRHMIVISVKDSGKGFGPFDIRKVFEPFYTTKSSGIGMGLSISQSIVRSHGGSLWAVANASGVGATVRMALPIVEASSPERSAGTRAKRVLIVDDHEGMRKALTRLIRTWGHTVAVAPEGRTALSQVDGFQPDVVVLDISLPGMNGVELVRRVREVTAARPPYLIALTASTDADTREACLAAGCDAFLTKATGIAEIERLLSA